MLIKSKQDDIIKSPDEFELEFRRIYSDLYPNEQVLKKYMEHYRQCYPIMHFLEVDRKPKARLEKLRCLWGIKPRESGVLENRSDYLFSDLKEIVGNMPIDLVYLEPRVVA